MRHCRALARASTRALWLSIPLILSVGAVQAREDVSSIKPLLIEAVRQGRAEGRMVGPAAEIMAKAFHSDQPVLVDVERLKPHQEAGCARLRIVTRQAAVQETVKGRLNAPADQSFAWQIDYCESGTFPVGEEGKE